MSNNLTCCSLLLLLLILLLFVFLSKDNKDLAVLQLAYAQLSNVCGVMFPLKTEIILFILTTAGSWQPQRGCFILT